MIDIVETMNAKGARSDFKIDVKRFLGNLVNFSLYLKKTSVDERLVVGKKFLNNMNGWLYRRKMNPNKINSRDHHSLYEGILFPFNPSENYQSTLIVRIIHQEITCFETKCRCPYRTVIETIDPEDLQHHTAKYEVDSDFESYLYIFDESVVL